MLTAGLTGGIGSGKSTVGAILVGLGCQLFDADLVVHELLQPGERVHQAVVRTFGAGIRTPQGTIDRKALGAIVFEDPAQREALNRIVHPAVIEREQGFLDRVRREDFGAIVIVDAALMIEVGTYRNYDRVIVVYCSSEKQKARLAARSGLSDPELETRIRAQMPMEEKVRYADYVINNSGSSAETKKQTESVYRKLLKDRGAEADS